MKALTIMALLAVPAAASTPAAWNTLDRTSAAACAKAADLKEPVVVGAPVRFSDAYGIDVRDVTGRYKPRHMKGAKARLLCLVERKTGRVEIQERAAR